VVPVEGGAHAALGFSGEAFDLADAPGLVEEPLRGAVEAQDDEPSLAGVVWIQLVSLPADGSGPK
jgi:hypothetical protein